MCVEEEKDFCLELELSYKEVRKNFFKDLYKKGMFYEVGSFFLMDFLEGF